MKKTYEKPVVMMEHFALTQCISACTVVKIAMLDYNCVANDPNSTLSLQNKAAQKIFMADPCEELPIDSIEEDGYCFFNGTAMVFVS